MATPCVSYSTASIHLTLGRPASNVTSVPNSVNDMACCIIAFTPLTDIE